MPIGRKISESKLREMKRLITAGLSSGEIAAQLSLHPGTIRRYRTTVMIGRGGTHYHKLTCRVVDKSTFLDPTSCDYTEVNLYQAKRRKTISGRSYRPCPICFGRKKDGKG